MDKLKDLRVLELLEATPPSKINSSRLYNLKPIGIGTPYVESLTSYTVRLAHAHVTIPGWLVKYEVFPRISILDKYFRNNTIWKNSNTLNSNGDWASEWVTIMQELTSRKDLIFLTLFPCSNVLPKMMLTKQKLAWCPLCYEEWREKGAIVYNPLIWHICGLEICGEHQKPLQSQCPHCQKEQEIMDSQMCVGYCQCCGKWLGKPADIKRSDISWDWQNRINYLLGDLLARVPEFLETPLTNKITKGRFAKLPELTNGNKAKLAREFHVSKKALNQWIKGDSLPQLGNLLKICCRLGVSVFDWLTDDSLEIELPEINSQTIPLPGKKVNRRPANMGQIERLLLAVGGMAIEPPMTINELAEILDYPPHYLGQKYSEPCELIKNNYQQFIRTKGKRRIENLRDDIRGAVFDLNSQGIFPTQGKVQKQLDKPALFKSPDLKQFYDEAIAELESQSTG